MPTRLHHLMAAFALLLASTGCVIREHNNPTPTPLPGNVNLVWRFTDGNSCASLNGFISHIQVTIPGENLQNAGQFPCTVAGTQGIQLQDFRAGSYSLTVQAIDTSGRAIYSFSGGFVVNGDVTVDAPLLPVASPGNVSLVWRFTDNNTCASLGNFISHMQVTIPGEQLQNFGQFPCTVAGTQGIQLNDFAPGSYTFTVEAIGSSGSPIYTFTGSFIVDGDVSVDVPLAPASHVAQPGNVTLLWQFGDGQTCASLAGLVDHVVINIPGQQLANGGSYPCSSAGTQGILLSNFQGSSYSYTVDAVDASGTPVYHGGNSFSVDGDVTTTAVLARTSAGGYGTLQLRWAFLDGQQVPHSCASAGVQNVRVTLPGFQQAVPCSVNGVDGADFVNMNAGSYSVQLDVMSDSTASAYPIYSLSQTVVVQAGQSTVLNAYLQPLYGTWDLSYNFANAASCNVAGVTQLAISLKDASNNEVADPNGRFTCQDGGALHWDAIAGGHYTIQMWGFSASGALVRGAFRSTDLVNGVANSTTITLDTCGTANSGC